MQFCRLVGCRTDRPMLIGSALLSVIADQPGDLEADDDRSS
jgi:hypothetical protein